MFGLSVYFVNCSGDLPDTSTGAKATSATSTQTLGVNVFPQQVTAGDSAQASVSGGQPPYTYSVTQGSATVSGVGVIHTTAQGAVLIAVHDKQARIAYGSLIVNPAAVVPPPPTPNPTPNPTPTPPPPPPPANCTTPWGQTVASGGQVIGFAGSNVTCPANCTPITATCSNGSFNVAVAAPSVVPELHEKHVKTDRPDWLDA